MYLVFVLLVLGVFVIENSRGSNDDTFELIQKGITEYITTKKKPDYFIQALKSYKLTNAFRPGLEKVYDNNEVCTLCSLVFDLMRDQRVRGLPKDSFVEVADYLCTALDIEKPRVCRGAIGINVDAFLYVFDHDPNIKSERFCGSVLQNFNCPKNGEFEWSISLPPGNPAQRPQLQTWSADNINILQISDFHYDKNYQIGGVAGCEEPICCQKDQGLAQSAKDGCGYWSDYRTADSPWHLVEETVHQTKTHNFDFVYYTGDIISHRVWETTVKNNTNTISKLYGYFKQQFEVPVFPVFGNHEPSPLNVWPEVDDARASVKWLFKLAALEWSLLIGRDVSATVLKGGYYSVSPKPGFRVIGLNGNICYTDNWWLMYNDVDPFNQLQWLAEELKKAEDANESVHILSHVPTGDTSCLEVWSREYRRVMERFSTTITGQFNGHTHRDEFHVYYNSSSPLQAVGVAFNGAAVTPYEDANPSYKVYTVDQCTYALLDYEEWTFNLTLANSKPADKPEWYKLYSFVEAYGVDNLQANEVDKVLYKMTKDHSLLDDYFRFYFRDGDEGIKGGCNETCRRENLCEIAKAQFGDYTQCNYFTGLYDEAE